MAAHVTATPVVLMCQDRHHTPPRWRHYFVVDGTDVVLVEMEPAILGWKTRKITRTPSSLDWGDMDTAAIVAWKLHNHPETIKCDGDETARVLAQLPR